MPPQHPRLRRNSGGAKKAVAGGEGYDSAGCDLGEVTAGATYEWTTTVVKRYFTTKLQDGTSTLETTTGTAVTCTGEGGHGDIQNAKEVAGVVFMFTGCSTTGDVSCGQGRAGEINTYPLSGVIGIEKGGAGASKAKLAEELHANGDGALVRFSCGTVPFVVTGSFLHPIKDNKMVQTNVVEKFTASHGKQRPDHFVGESEQTLYAELNGGSLIRAGQKMVLRASFEEAIEANSVV